MTDVQTSLQQRLQALRTSSHTTKSTENSSSSSVPTKSNTAETEEDEGDISELLESLEVPDEAEDELAVPVEIKNVSDEQVDHYLNELAKTEVPPLPPISRSIPQKQLESTLSSYESKAPAFVSPIEVQFFPSASIPSLRTDDDEQALIDRLNDELSVESQVEARSGDPQTAWEKRLNEMKDFKPATDPEKEKMYRARLGEGLEEAPKLDGLEKLEKLSKKSKARKKGSDSEEEDETTTEEEDSDKDSDEE